MNGYQVELEKNQNNHYRGLHIVVINPSNGIVDFARVFDTYQTSERFEEFVGQVPAGHIVVAACMDDCVTKLSEKVKRWFETMGSTEILKLEYRCGFAFVGLCGKKGCHERRAFQKGAQAFVTQVFQIEIQSCAQDAASAKDSNKTNENNIKNLSKSFQSLNIQKTVETSNPSHQAVKHSANHKLCFTDPSFAKENILLYAHEATSRAQTVSDVKYDLTILLSALKPCYRGLWKV